jgi:hypothetical protein
MERFARLTGRRYELFEYCGDPQAERVIIMMGSGAEAAHDTVDHLVARGESVGLLKVRLFRPFSPAHLIDALPASASRIAVLDRCKEPGAAAIVMCSLFEEKIEAEEARAHDLAEFQDIGHGEASSYLPTHTELPGHRDKYLEQLRGLKESLDIPATGGVHTPEDALKMFLCGADVCYLCSTLLTNGTGQLRLLSEGLVEWLTEHESLEQLRGSMSQQHCPDPVAFERGNYMKILESHRLPARAWS